MYTSGKGQWEQNTREVQDQVSFLVSWFSERLAPRAAAALASPGITLEMHSHTDAQNQKLWGRGPATVV